MDNGFEWVLRAGTKLKYGVTRNLPDDKNRDVSVYEDRARHQLAHASTPVLEEVRRGAPSVEPFYRAPYEFYEQRVRDTVLPAHDVLEIGSGTGRHTWSLIRTGARVTATDLSENALSVLHRNLSPFAEGRLRTKVADMEALPFADASFDVVASAGSLSYGDPSVVDREILRVLRSGGAVIIVDSLDHNPLYRLQRRLQLFAGKRTRSTLQRMPTLARLESLGRQFASFDIRFFGAISWATPVLARVIGADRAASLSDWADRVLHVERSAFKFVLVARGR